MRNAEAITLPSNPTTTCGINGARTAASMAGCAQANISARRRFRISASIAAAIALLLVAASAVVAAIAVALATIHPPEARHRIRIGNDTGLFRLGLMNNVDLRRYDFFRAST